MYLILYYLNCGYLYIVSLLEPFSSKNSKNKKHWNAKNVEVKNYAEKVIKAVYSSYAYH